MKRKILITLLTFILALCAISLTACSGKDNNSGGETPPTVQTPGDDNGDNNGDNGSDDNGCDGDNSPTEYVSTAGLEYTLSTDETYYICSGIGTATSTDIVIGSKYNDLPVTGIGETAFRHCTSLTSITIPNSVTSIGDDAFYDCSKLESVTIPNSVTSIGSSAFAYCSKLTKVNYLGSIDSWAMIDFYGGYSNPLYYANNLYINDVLVTEANLTIATYISDRAFCECSSLESVTIGNSVTSIGDFAFAYCSSLTSITIPDSVTSIGYCAFYDCSSLTSVTIPDSVTSIDYSAFAGCDSFTSVTVDSGNTIYHSADNCIIKTASKTLIVGCKNSVIPTDGSVTSIGKEAFYNCDSLTSITIPDRVTSIGYNAFGWCDNLTSVTIGNSVTSIDVWAFRSCSSLTSITIPDSVTSIGDEAFYYCSSLESITYNGTKAQWNVISKGRYWNLYTGNYTIHCTDGDI